MSEKLDLKLEIFLPTEFDFTNDYHRSLLDILTREFGGVLVCQNNLGAWLKPTNKSVPPSEREIEYDRVSVFRIHTTEAFFKSHSHRAVFYQVIESIKKAYSQTSVAFAINDAMEFY